MDTLLTLRRPIKDVKPRRNKFVKVKKVSAQTPPAHNSLRKKRKPVESAAAPPTLGLGSFVALYREACGADRERYHNSPFSDDAERLQAPGSFALPLPPTPSLGGGDARRPLVHVVMEMEY